MAGKWNCTVRRLVNNPPSWKAGELFQGIIEDDLVTLDLKNNKTWRFHAGDARFDIIVKTPIVEEQQQSVKARSIKATDQPAGFTDVHAFRKLLKTKPVCEGVDEWIQDYLFEQFIKFGVVAESVILYGDDAKIQWPVAKLQIELTRRGFEVYHLENDSFEIRLPGSFEV